MGGDTKNGFNRPAYSDEESCVMQYFAERARASCLNHYLDTLANLVIETSGHFDHWIETGSHVDTVAAGGNYDGLAGVVAGFEALLSVSSSRIPLKHGLRLRIWRGEESASFGITSIGSRAAFAELPAASLQQRYQGKTLAHAMGKQHANPQLIEQMQASISKHEKEQISAYIEMHIEQGKVLENEQLDIGIVTAIRGSRRSWVTLSGAFDHSGATPMGTTYRQDCNLAMAYMHVRLDKLLQSYNRNGSELVQTIGMINSSSDMNEKLLIQTNAVSKVSGLAYFSFEVRGCDAASVAAYCEQAEAVICNTAAEFATQAEIETFSDQSGIPALDQAIQQHATDACKTLNLSHMSMPSGAWHDAAVVAAQQQNSGSTIPTGMIFIPCRDGISHSADEYTSPQAIAAGASVLATTMLHLASTA